MFSVAISIPMIKTVEYFQNVFSVLPPMHYENVMKRWYLEDWCINFSKPKAQNLIAITKECIIDRGILVHLFLWIHK